MASRPADAGSGDRIAVVIPCFNEAKRLDLPRFRAFLERESSVELLFVDDGSTDATREVLARLCAQLPRCAVLSLGRNAGKGEAVRRGIQQALASAPDMVGYWDADLAIAPDAIHDFARVLRQRPQLHAVIGSRVQLMGRVIRRSQLRHYLGRAFATAASLVIGMPVYDTQCGAKLFRVTDAVRAVFRDRFVSRWIFDVEVLARLARETGTSGWSVPVYEFPLEHWENVPGSKVGVSSYLNAGFELLEIWQLYPRTDSSTTALRAPVEPGVPQ